MTSYLRKKTKHKSDLSLKILSSSLYNLIKINMQEIYKNVCQAFLKIVSKGFQSILRSCEILHAILNSE